MTDKITTPTWVIHGVFDEEHTIVYHTHGLKEYDLMELEMTLPLEKQVAQDFLNLIGLEIANGRSFKDGEKVEKLFNVPIVFRIVDGIHGDNEKHLRVIFPDANNKFPWDDGCDAEYAKQI